MKRFLCLIFALILTFSLVACSNGDKDKSSSSAGSQGAASSEGASQSGSEADASQPQAPSGPEYAAKMRAMLEGTGEYADNPVVTIETSEGNIKVRLFPQEAPKAVENFLTHAKDGYYDGVSFHRIINDFMIQGGDPKGDGTGGESIWGDPFEIEYTDYLWSLRGSLAMANAGPGTNGSQFFIVQGNNYEEQKATMEQIGYPQEVLDLYEELGGVPHLDWLNPQQGLYGYTRFGYVIEGMDVVDKIAALDSGEVNDQGSPTGKPSKPVTIVKMTVEE